MKSPLATSLLCSALAASVITCGVRYVDVSGSIATAGDTADLAAGSTALVAIVNPVVNIPHKTGVPAELGDARDGIDVDPEPGGAGVTIDGLAIAEIVVGAISIGIGPAVLGLEVDAEGDVFDAPIAFDGATAAYFPNTPVRYSLGERSGAIFFDPDVAIAEISAVLAEDSAIVVLRPGVYVGDFVLRGRDVVLFGEGWAQRSVVIDGSVSAQGSGIRIRGVTITGDLAAKGREFGISFSRVFGVADITGNGGALVRNTFCGQTTVPAMNATLLDNYGIAPLEALAPGACDL